MQATNANDVTYSNLINWLVSVNQSDLPPKNIVAFNFGLFENPKGCYTTYLIGSRNFDPENDDWACNDDYTPIEKYLELSEHRSAEKDWQEVLRDMVDLLRRYTQSPEFPESFLANATAITVGFDDGDLERVK